MPLDADILITYGATLSKCKKNTFLYRQDEKAKYYFQIMDGQVKTFNISANGKEFVQGIFNAGDSFGEPPIFIREPYAANALTTKDSIILKLPIKTFFEVLHDHPHIQLDILRYFAQKIYDKSVSARIISQQVPEQRILEFLTHYKKKTSSSADRMLIPFTRQEMANLTGLRIETVIRTLRKLHETQKVDILDHKVYF
jgi:CRP-like cAMP-binding protein